LTNFKNWLLIGDELIDGSGRFWRKAMQAFASCMWSYLVVRDNQNWRCEQFA